MSANIDIVKDIVQQAGIELAKNFNFYSNLKASIGDNFAALCAG
jgi:hypothetical protein